MLAGDHVLTVSQERRKLSGSDKYTSRFRGRCSCGYQTHLHYSTPLAAKTALTRTHLADMEET